MANAKRRARLWFYGGLVGIAVNLALAFFEGAPFLMTALMSFFLGWQVGSHMREALSS